MTESPDEAERLAALKRYAILDTPREAEFDDIVTLAARLLDAPVAVVNLIADGRQWFKAEVGLGVRETPLESSFCLHALLQDELMVVPDTRLDPRFSCNPLVVEPPHLRAYAGALLKTPAGVPIGTLCVLDYRPRAFDRGQLDALRALARQVMSQLELRRALSEKRTGEATARQILDSVTDYAIIATDPDGLVTSWNEGARRIFGQTEAEMSGLPASVILTPEDVAGGRPAREMTKASEEGHAEAERWHIRADGERFWASGEMMPRKDEAGAAIGFIKLVRDRTEQRRATVALEDSAADVRRVQQQLDINEEALRLATDAAEVGTWDLDVIEDVLIWPLRTRAMFGISPGAPCTMADFYAGLHPDDRAATGLAFASALDPARRSTYDVQYRTIGKEDGLVRWVAARGKALFDAEGRCVRAIGTAVDITASKRADARQTALLRLGDRLRDLEDGADMAFAAAEILATTLQVSRAGYGTIDPLRETITVERDWNAPGIESLAGTLRFRDYGSYIEDLKRGELVICADARTDPRTRTTVAALEAINARAFINMAIVERGAFVALLYLNHADVYAWSTEDIAFVQAVADRTRIAMERQRAETALRDLAASLEQRVQTATRERDQVWQASTDLLCVADFRGYLVSLNPAWSRTLGWTDAELKGRPFVDFVHEDDRQALQAAAAKLALGEPQLSFEHRCRCKDATYRWLSWNAAPREGRIYANIRDVSEAKALDQRNAELEEQLRQAQKMEAVGQLTGGVAHDFNNLLAGISGSLEMMQARISQGRLGEVDRYLAAASGAAKRAAALTHRLLAFSRRQTLAPKPTGVNRLIAGMDDLVRRAVGPAIELEVVGAAGLWNTLVDPHQLENALLNLCINARDAMPTGGRITIETANRWLDERAARDRDLPPGQFVSLCVTDTGVGMTPEVAARAFDPFFTTKPLGQGTGLGLSMIYGFARQSDGQVRIYSELGQGTTMCIYLPRYQGEVDCDTAPETLQRAPRTEAERTVLVVDDEPTVRMLVADVLEEIGYTAVEAEDGPAALKLLQSNLPIDLLVTDVGLPGGMNGRQVADAARTARPDLKVLFITGYAENAAVGHGHLDAGMEVMTKPFTIEGLATRIRNLTTAL